MRKYAKAKIKTAIILATAVMIFCGAAYAEEPSAPQDLVDEYLGIYGERLDEGAGGVIFDAVTPYADGFSIGELLSRIAAGDVPFDLRSLAGELFRALTGKMLYAAKNMAGVLAAAVLSAFLANSVSGFERGAAFKAASYVCFIAVASMAASVFYGCLVSASSAIENLAVFMRCAVPVMMTALLSSGAAVSAAALEPTLLAIIEIAVSLIRSVFVPLVMIGAGLGTVNAMSEGLKTARLVEFINGAVKYGLSVILMIFTAFSGLRGIAASGADALTLKLTKFASSNLIPLVGGILSDSVETVMRCGAVIKNALGVLGIIVVFFIALTPVIEIVSALIVFRLAAALCEPISEKSVTECLSVMADGIAAVFSMLAAVSIMFIIMLTVMINISV